MSQEKHKESFIEKATEQIFGHHPPAAESPSIKPTLEEISAKLDKVIKLLEAQPKQGPPFCNYLGATSDFPIQ